LFLYIILLLNLRTYSLVQRINFYLLGAMTILLFIMLVVFLITKESSLLTSTTYTIISPSDLNAYTRYLFNSHQLYLLFAILLLLVALIIALFNTSTFTYTQNISKKIYKAL